MDIIVRKITQTKGIILLGIIFILALVSIKIGGAKSTVPARRIVSPTPSVRRRLINPNTQLATKSVAKFDIKGKYECNQASRSARISNKKMYLENKKEKVPSYVVFNGDCLYSWKEGLRTGAKKCGFGVYLGVYESLSGMGVVDGGSLLSTVLDSGLLNSIVPASQSAALSNTEEVKKSFAESCRPTNSVDENLFVVPKNITFTEQKEE